MGEGEGEGGGRIANFKEINNRGDGCSVLENIQNKDSKDYKSLLFL